MTDAPDDLKSALQRAAGACEIAAALLRSADVTPEALAAYLPPRRGFLRTRPPTMLPIGRVWRIGPLLISADVPDGEASLFAVGRATRSAERGRPGYQSSSREERSEIAAAALRGGYAIGTPVNFDASPIFLTDPVAWGEAAQGPVGFARGEMRVRWSAGATLEAAPTLAAFLADRVSLLTDPPPGTT